MNVAKSHKSVSSSPSVRRWRSWALPASLCFGWVLSSCGGDEASKDGASGPRVLEVCGVSLTCGDSCSDDEACPSGQFCSDGKCYAECTPTSGCNGTCQRDGRCAGQRQQVVESGFESGGEPVLVGGSDDPSVSEELAECATSSASGQLSPVAMFVMFDRSSSMRQMVQGSTRWDVATDALVQFFQDPGSADLRVAYGVFPGATNGCDNMSCSAESCAQPVVPVGTLTAQSGGADPHEQALVSYVNGDEASTEGLGLGTPTSVALDGALRWAASYQDSHPGESATVVLVTDGEPTGCDTNIGNIANFASTALSSHGIRTYAIGLTGSREGDMNRIAQAGGTSSGIFIGDGENTGQQLLSALAQIRGEVASCDLQMPDPPPGAALDPNRVNIDLTLSNGSVTLAQVSGPAECGDVAGWHYDDNQRPRRILLCPATCDAVQRDRMPTINVVLGCISNTVPPNIAR